MTDLLARARELRPALIERAAETERRTFYPERTHQDFLAAGFYRMLVPRRYGGLDVDLETFYRVIMEVAHGDVSTAWCLALASSHAHNVAAMFGERAQDEIFGGGDFRCPAVAAPSGQAVPVDGGWELTGKWGYCSGSPYATHYMGQTFGASARAGGPRGQMLLFVAPRSVWTRLDDWGRTLGLKGSGSHSITMERAFLPAHLVLQDAWIVDADPSANPGIAIHGRTSYAGRTLAIFQVGLTALAIGGLRAALDEYEQLLRTRNTQRPPIVKRCDDPDYQLWFGRALGRVAAAEAALTGLLRRHEQLCARSVNHNVAYTREDDLRLNIVARDALTFAWTALQDDIFRTAGTSATVNGARLERVFRDVAMDWGHFGTVIRDWAGRELARERLGLTSGPALRPDRAHTAARS